jgi:hypothetical protein
MGRFAVDRRRLTKHSFAIDIFDTEPETGRENCSGDVQIEEKGDPGPELL